MGLDTQRYQVPSIRVKLDSSYFGGVSSFIPPQSTFIILKKKQNNFIHQKTISPFKIFFRNFFCKNFFEKYFFKFFLKIVFEKYFLQKRFVIFLNFKKYFWKKN